MSGEWSNGLFGCFNNCGLCVISYFVPCYTVGKTAEKVGEDCLTCGLVQIVPIANLICGAKIREKVRESKGIEGSFLMDILTLWCCYCCAVIQAGNEVDALGGGGQTIARE